MKKLILGFAALLAVVSCTGNTYTIKGTISETDMTQGAVVVLANSLTNAKDTALINGGTFTFTGEADVNALAIVSLALPSGARNPHACQVVLEKGTIVVDLDSANVVSAGPVNKIFKEYQEKSKSIVDGYYANPEAPGALESAQNALDQLADEFYAPNKENAVGFQIGMSKLYDFETLADFDDFLANASEAFRTNDKVLKIREALSAAEATAEGKMFTDFPGENADGSEASLASYVGQGKYVLADFWASWCGPCKAEIPNIINVYNTYGKDGLVVIGVPVWDKRPDTDKAIEALGIKYPQLYVGDDKTSTEIYGINGIPHIILFGPDGTIVKRNLRGEAIEAAVKEALGK